MPACGPASSSVWNHARHGQRLTRRRSGAAGWAALLCVLPVLYVLSIGPVVFVCKKLHSTPAHEGALVFFHTPLIVLSQKAPFTKLLGDYVDW